VSTPEQPQPRSVWKRRAVIAAVVIVLLVIGYFVATSFLPRWWSHRVGDQVDGTFRWGIFWGLVYGVLCTLVPILVARQAIYRQIGWRGKGWIVLLAIVLALPNLMTLGITWGSGSGAHAGQRTLDDQAPGFRGATLAGFIVALALAVLIEIALQVRRRHSAELTALRVDKKIHDARED
jgi:energy-coupling factor transporter transmembrane protein EcfT